MAQFCFGKKNKDTRFQNEVCLHSAPQYDICWGSNSPQQLFLAFPKNAKFCVFLFRNETNNIFGKYFTKPFKNSTKK